MMLDKKTYVKQAEDVISNRLRRDRNNNIALTTNQIRNLLTLMNDMCSVIRHDPSEKLSEDMQSRAQYIKMRFAYNAGRDDNVRDFVSKSQIMEYLDGVGDSREALLLVCNYFEALVAYHKFYGGRDH